MRECQDGNKMREKKSQKRVREERQKRMREERQRRMREGQDRDDMREKRAKEE